MIATYRNATAEELAELVGLTAAERRVRIRAMFRSHVLVPVRGGSPEGDGEGEGGGNGEGEGDGEGEGEGEPEADTVPKAELDKAQKAAAAKDKELRELKQQNEERERKEREAGGKFEELYKAELDKVKERDARIAELEAELDTERKGRGRDKSERFVLSELTSAGAWSPNIALRQIDDGDLEGIDSEAKAKKAVEALRKKEPRLFEDKPTRQKRGGGSSDNGGSDTDKEPFGPAKLRRHFAGKG